MQRALLDQWKLVVTFVTVGVGVVALGTLLARPWYTAVTVLQIMPTVNASVNPAEAKSSSASEVIQTEIRILQSEDVQEAVADRYRSLGYTDLPAGSEGIAHLNTLVSVAAQPQTQLVEVRVKHTEANAAATLANLMAEVYREKHLAFRLESAQEAQGWLDKQIEEAQRRLVATTDALNRIQEQSGSLPTEGAQEEAAVRLNTLQTALATATTTRLTASIRLEEHEKLFEEGRTTVLAGMYEDPTLRAVLDKQALAHANVAQRKARYGSAHRDTQRAETELREINVLVAIEVERLLQAEQAQYEELERLEVELGAEVDYEKEQLQEREQLRRQSTVLMAEESQAREQLAALQRRRSEVDLATRTQASDVRIVDPAHVPTKPSRPNAGWTILLALCVSALGGMAVALVRYQHKDKVLGIRDVERITGLPVIGTIPSLPPNTEESARRLYPVSHPDTLSAEAYRSLRTMLHVRAFHNGSLVLMVTSGAAGEGKTSVAVGLGASFARMGLQTLIIDADTRQPRLHQVFGGEQDQGLCDTLRDQKDPVFLARPTPVPLLSYMAAGNTADGAAELLHSPLFREMIVRLEQLFPVIIIDTAPVGLVADPLSFLSMVDAVLLVVRRNHAPSRLALDALGQLSGARARVVGAVLNDVPTHADPPSFYGGYVNTSAPRQTG